MKGRLINESHIKSYGTLVTIFISLLLLFEFALYMGLRSEFLKLPWGEPPKVNVVIFRNLLTIIIMNSFLYTILFFNDPIMDKQLKLKLRHATLFFLLQSLNRIVLDFLNWEKVRIYADTAFLLDIISIFVFIYLVVISKTIYLNIYKNIENTKILTETLKRLSITDRLTNLFNRSKFHQDVIDLIQSNQNEHLQFSILFLDLDNFKSVNDTLGHNMGDELLIETSKRLKILSDESSQLYRLGGDEFTFILQNKSISEVEEFTKKVIDLFRLPFLIHSQEFFISTSVGIALYPLHGLNCDVLMKNADTAMYHAKQSGKNRYKFYTNTMNDNSMLKLTIENGLRKAIKRNEFILYYQPEIDLSTGKIIAVEALLRWKNPCLGLVPPASFIPIAEDSGLIYDIGEWALKEACNQQQKWSVQYADNISIAVNVSAMQLRNQNFNNLVTNTINITGISSKNLELEITETMLMKNAKEVTNILETFQNMNICIAIDDFGTGYSSLSYLKKLPINKLKIDRSFISDIPKSKDDDAIVKAIISLGHSLNLKVVAEGVENIEQLNFLKEQDCDIIQGYIASPPIPIENLLQLLSKDTLILNL